MVHDPGYVRMIEERAADCPPHTCRYLDPDTYHNSHSYEVARYAAGGAILAAGQARDGIHSFAMVRPPGHHACRSRAMGFCIFNNCAIAAMDALHRERRVAIIDWDVHHGNGTQEAFYRNGRVMYCSVHQAPYYPGTGWPEERGAGDGHGMIVNAPLPPGSGIGAYSRVFSEVFAPAVEAFDPGLILVSAGQDCLADDPLGGMSLLPEDFGTLAGLVSRMTDNALALVLEGGYGPSHGAAVRAILRALGG